MTPRETNNKPPEDNQPTATQREWERLWEQGDEGGGQGGKEVSAGSESGRGTEADSGPGSERDADSGTAPAVVESAPADNSVHDEEPQAPGANAYEASENELDTHAETAPTPVQGNDDEPAPSHTHGNADGPGTTHTHGNADGPGTTHTHDHTDGPGTTHTHDHTDGPGATHTHDGSTAPHSHAAPDEAHTHPHPHPADADRIAAVRRVAAASRRWRTVQLAGCAALLAVAMTAGAIAIGAAKDSGATGVAASSAVSPELLASGSLDASIASLQAHLRTQPKDFDGWATLGLAYVEQARTKGDPSRYPQAQAALQRSLKISPGNENALEGRAALAAARHEFAEALTYADQVLKENPYSERALCSRIDALVELGRYADASKAADLADARKPGVPVFTRYAYVHELRGDVTTARKVLEQALAAATSPGDISYVAGTLGQLAWNQGDYKTALNDYGRALAADENYLPALEGRARSQAALGDRAEAIKGMELVVSRYPLPQPLVELGELYESRGAAGDKAKAGDQYALVDAWIALARANGVNADLDTALAAADHGNIKSALKAARAEWARRHTVHTADALAWALHVNGLDKEALPYARRATATGYHNASFIYHLGIIELATGHKADGRAHLTKALKLNPGFSPLGASKARKALEATK
ncbi:tetratricopeptide repeat protein [Streptomyces sp. NBC_00343]|uniref:tetratricopeptide repeat protein n=1 Tax=Streptomyces sp. NBC_00343 TaxID=2975719 RepID=UPI002E2D34AA|nr:tetratricopeptide repeat protein [Streptomyces sp. NBC_00343]